MVPSTSCLWRLSGTVWDSARLQFLCSSKKTLPLRGEAAGGKLAVWCLHKPNARNLEDELSLCQCYVHSSFWCKRIDAGNFWWLYIYICMYMYRGSSYINWLFIPECCCLLCSLSLPCGCSLAVCEQLIVKPFQKFNNLLEFHEVPLVPAPLAGAELCLLQLSLGREKGELAEGTEAALEWLNLCSWHVGCLDVVNVLITEAVIEHMDLGFFPGFHHTGLPGAGLGELAEQGPPRAEGVGCSIKCVYVCIYAHMYIFIQQVCTLGFSLVVKTGDLAPSSALNSARQGEGVSFVWPQMCLFALSCRKTQTWPVGLRDWWGHGEGTCCINKWVLGAGDASPAPSTLLGEFPRGQHGVCTARRCPSSCRLVP